VTKKNESPQASEAVAADAPVAKSSGTPDRKGETTSPVEREGPARRARASKVGILHQDHESLVQVLAVIEELHAGS